MLMFKAALAAQKMVACENELWVKSHRVYEKLSSSWSTRFSWGQRFLRKVKYTYSILDFQNHDVKQEDFLGEGERPTHQ